MVYKASQCENSAYLSDHHCQPSSAHGAFISSSLLFVYWIQRLSRSPVISKADPTPFTCSMAPLLHCLHNILCIPIVSYLICFFFFSQMTTETLASFLPMLHFIINCGKPLKRWEYQTILPLSWETCVQVKKQQLEPCMEQLVDSRLRKEYESPVWCHPVCLIYRLSTLCKMPSWLSYKLESR